MNGTHPAPPALNWSGIPQLGAEFDLRPPPASSVPLAPVKRVALFAEAFLPKFDGVSKTALLTLRHLQLTGREVLVFAPDTAPRAIGPTQIIPLPSLGMPLYPETRIALPTVLVRHYLDDFRPDLVQLFSPAFLSLSGVLAARAMHIPIVANYQTDLPGYTEQYGYPLLNTPIREGLRLLHNLCHLTLAPSTHTIRELRSWGFHRLRYWGRGVDSQRFNPRHRSAAWRRRLLAGRPAEDLLCLYVGRLAREKRLDLLRGVADLPGVALTIVGDGALRAEAEALFAGTRTHFTGYLFGEDLAQAYASADVFVFTGTNETFGQVVLEAMASGLPVVVPDSGGVTDMAIPGQTGLRCQPTPDSFAQAVLLLRDNPALRRRLATGARRYAESRPWEAMMALLERHYSRAVRLNMRFNRLYNLGQAPPGGWSGWGNNTMTR